MSHVTQILSRIQGGEKQAAEQLLPLVYEELRDLARARMASERADHTLQATALVHEAYVRLVDVEVAQHWDSKGHFFAAAAEAMRRILVDRAREKSSQKRGGNQPHFDVNLIDVADTTSPAQILAIDEAITRLEELDPVAAKLVKLRYFAGQSVEQGSKSLGISTTTGYRHWNYARAWLHGELVESTQS